MHTRPLLLASFALLLVACTPTDAPGASSSSSSSAAPTASGSTALTVTFSKTVSEDDQAVQHTKATLALAGAVTTSIDLGEIVGELQYVNPSAYGPYAQPAGKGETVAVLTSWFAGEGEEIIVTQFHDPHRFTVERRYGDESGTCTTTELVKDVELPGDVTIELKGFVSPVDQSTLAFCHEQDTEHGEAVSMHIESASTTPDENNVQTTKTYLVLSGDIEDRLLLDDMEADAPLVLQYVDPSIYKKTNILAGFSHYYAGGGYDVAVRRDDAGNIVVQRRGTYEGDAENDGGCEEWKDLKKYDASSVLKVSFENLGDPIEQVIMPCEW